MNAVEVKEIVHEYPAKRRQPARRALAWASLDVAEGELFGLLGPNGGGKSTLFRILATSLIPTSGRARIFERDIVTEAATVRPWLGVVFQSPSLDGKLSVRENLTHGGHLYGLSGAPLTARITEMLERYRLTDRAGDVVGSLSGGLRRRVELAKCLLHKPRMLLLDEPSTGLDPAARQDLWNHILELKREGVTILTTTHLMDEGDRCDRIAILDKGRIVATGKPGDLKSQIGGDVITIESDDAGALAHDIAEKFSVKPDVYGTTLRFEKESGHTFVPPLVEAFPGRVRSISLSRPSLEDVFLHHAGRRFADEDNA